METTFNLVRYDLNITENKYCFLCKFKCIFDVLIFCCMCIVPYIFSSEYGNRFKKKKRCRKFLLQRIYVFSSLWKLLFSTCSTFWPFPLFFCFFCFLLFVFWVFLFVFFKKEGTFLNDVSVLP